MNALSSFKDDPLGTYAEFYSNPGNWIKLFPAINLYLEQFENAKSDIEVLTSGDFNAMAERLGMNFDELAEALLFLKIVGGLGKYSDTFFHKTPDIEVIVNSNGDVVTVIPK